MMGIRQQKITKPNSQDAKVVFAQTERIFEDGRKDVIQAYIKYKAYYERKIESSKLKEREYMCALQAKTDHHGSKVSSQIFGGLDHSSMTRLCQTTIIWYVKFLLTPHKNFIA